MTKSPISISWRYNTAYLIGYFAWYFVISFFKKTHLHAKCLSLVIVAIIYWPTDVHRCQFMEMQNPPETTSYWKNISVRVFSPLKWQKKVKCVPSGPISRVYVCENERWISSPGGVLDAVYDSLVAWRMFFVCEDEEWCANSRYFEPERFFFRWEHVILCLDSTLQHWCIPNPF